MRTAVLSVRYKQHSCSNQERVAEVDSKNSLCMSAVWDEHVLGDWSVLAHADSLANAMTTDGTHLDEIKLEGRVEVVPALQECLYTRAEGPTWHAQACMHSQACNS